MTGMLPLDQPTHVALAVLAVATACAGEEVTLGRRPPPLGVGGASPAPLALQVTGVRPVSELNGPDKDDNVTLTADLLEVCFTSTRAGGAGDVDVWCAERSRPTDVFSVPTPVAAANSPGFETSSALSLDGLTLWFASERAGGRGGLDVWRTQREQRAQGWGEPALEVGLNSPADDIPRSPGHDSIMPLSSRRREGIYWTYFSRWESPGFSSPRLVVELAERDRVVVDGFLSADGLLLLVTSAEVSSDDPGDLYSARRPRVGAPFGPLEPIEGANSEGDDRDPWLSSDGTQLYFASNRDGDFDIYVADVVR